MLIKLETKSDRVKGLSFHLFRPWILASLHTGEIQLWDYRRSILLEKFTGHEGPVRGVNFHNQQPLFVSGGDDYKVKVWNYKQKKCIFTLVGHNDYVRTTVFHVEYPWIASASDDQTVRIWNWQSRSSLCVLAGHNHYVMCATFHPTADLLLSAALDQTVRVWDISGLRKTCKDGINLFTPGYGVMKYLMEGHTRGVNWASFHHNLSLIASGGDDHQVKLWRYEDDKVWEVCSYIGHYKNVSSVIFHKKEDLLISNGEDRALKVWDLMSKTCVYTFRRERDRFWMLTAHPTLNLFAAGHDSGMMIFKLERERPVFCLLLNSLFYVKSKTVRKFDFKTSKDSPIIFITNISWNNPVRNISVSQEENSILICVDAREGSYYELRELTKTEVNYRRHQAKTARWISKNTFVVVERSNRLNIRNLRNEIIMPLQGVCDEIFSCLQLNIIALRNLDIVTLYDTQKLIPVAKIKIKKCKLMIWSPNHDHVVLVNKYQIYICDGLLRKIATVKERLKIKSGAWDGEHVFVYTTTNHIKYTLINGENGVIRTLDVPIYITRVHNGTIHCLDRECQFKIFNIDTTEYYFKLALINRDYSKVINVIRNNRLVGQSIICYLDTNGFTNVALHFVKDKNTSFELALKCGNLKVALKSAYALNESHIWLKLAKSALQLGYLNVAEICYKQANCPDKLFFLYLITGNFHKMRFLGKHCGSSKEYHTGLLLGNIQERIKILMEVKKNQLAYLTAITHGLDHDAEFILNSHIDLSGLNIKHEPVAETFFKSNGETTPGNNKCEFDNRVNNKRNEENSQRLDNFSSNILKSQENSYSHDAHPMNIVGEENTHILDKLDDVSKEFYNSPVIEHSEEVNTSGTKTQLAKYERLKYSKSIEEIRTGMKVSQLRQQFENSEHGVTFRCIDILDSRRYDDLIFQENTERSNIIEGSNIVYESSIVNTLPLASNPHNENSVKESSNSENIIFNSNQQAQNVAILETSEESTSSFEVVLKSAENYDRFAEHKLLNNCNVSNTLEYLKNARENNKTENSSVYFDFTSELDSSKSMTGLKSCNGQEFNEILKDKLLKSKSTISKETPDSTSPNKLLHPERKIKNPKFLRAPPPIQKLSINWPLVNVNHRFVENLFETARDSNLDARTYIEDEETDNENVSDGNQSIGTTDCNGWDIEDQTLSIDNILNETSIVCKIEDTMNRQTSTMPKIENRSQTYLPEPGKCTEIKLPGLYARLGNYEKTFDLLNSQVGVVNFEPYRELLREICGCRLGQSWQKHLEPRFIYITPFLSRRSQANSRSKKLNNEAYEKRIDTCEHDSLGDHGLEGLEFTGSYQHDMENKRSSKLKLKSSEYQLEESRMSPEEILGCMASMQYYKSLISSKEHLDLQMSSTKRSDLGVPLVCPIESITNPKSYTEFRTEYNFGPEVLSDNRIMYPKNYLESRYTADLLFRDQSERGMECEILPEHSVECLPKPELKTGMFHDYHLNDGYSKNYLEFHPSSEHLKSTHKMFQNQYLDTGISSKEVKISREESLKYDPELRMSYKTYLVSSPKSFGMGSTITLARQSSTQNNCFGSIYLLTIQELIKKIQSAYKLTTSGKFELAIAEFRKMFPQITLLMVNKYEEMIAGDLIKISSEYILGLKLEVYRRSLPKTTPKDQKKQCELSAYFTHLNFLTIHKIFTLRLALNICFKAKNFKSAQRFANRLLELKPSSEIVGQVNKMLLVCQQNCVDALEFDYDELKPFVLCGFTYKPIYNGYPAVKCCLCDCSYSPEFRGFLCNICTVSEIGFNASGLKVTIG